MVKSVPFFQNAASQFVSAVITRLKFEVFLKGEYIIRAGTKGDRMFFIQSGVVEVVLDNGIVATCLSDGAHFGEICLLTEDRRVADVIASTTTDLFSLSKENFHTLLEEFPDMREPLEAIAMHRLKKIGKKASYTSIGGSCNKTRRTRLSTNIPPPPIIVDNSDDNKSYDELQHQPKKNISLSESGTVKKTGSFGRRKLSPLQIITHPHATIPQRPLEPSEDNPHTIQYPSSDDDLSDEEK